MLNLDDISIGSFLKILTFEEVSKMYPSEENNPETVLVPSVHFPYSISICVDEVTNNTRICKVLGVDANDDTVLVSLNNHPVYNNIWVHISIIIHPKTLKTRRHK